MTPNDHTNDTEDERDERTLEVTLQPGKIPESFLSIGTMVEGKYRLVDSIGEGGMGIVYKVEQVLLNRQMALKTLTGNEFSESSIKRFHAEAKLLAKLDHPGLVKVRDFGFIDNVKPFLVMDFVQGRTLSSVLKTSGVVPLDVAIKIFVELCFALGYAHSHNIVHRDIKPSNIMLTTPGIDSENEHVKVLDFGIAKLLHRGLNETDSLTRTGEIIGSPFYMSPEQCLGKPVDHRSDIYSMGCVMFEVLTGAPPFSGETSIATIMKHQSEKPTTLKEASMGREFPEEIEILVASMLEKDPDKRVQSLLDVAQMLIGIQKGLSSTAILQKSVSVPQKKQSNPQTKYLLISACILLTGVLGMLGLIFYNQQQTQKPIEQAPDLPRRPWSKISEDGRFRIFTFPDNFSIGQIGYARGTRYRKEARGTVTVPAAAEVMFMPNSLFLSHPQFMNNFAEDDITLLDFKEAGLTETAFSSYKITAQSPLSDSEMVYVDHLKSLKSLCLKNCEISDAGLQYIRDLPLRILNVDGTDVTWKGLSSLNSFMHLEYLRACHLREGGKIIKALKGSRAIRELALTASDLSDEDLKDLDTMPNLTHLNIGYNPKITDKGLKYLTRLPSLQFISIEECSITGRAAIDAFKAMRLPYRPRLGNRLGEEINQEITKIWPRERPE